MNASERIFDTLVDTTKLYVSMKTYFTLRPLDNNKEKALVYLFITGNKKRERINFDIHILVKDWDKANQRLFPTSKENQDYNLIYL